MKEIITSDGNLARHPGGDGFALVFDRHVIGEQTVEALTAFDPDCNGQGLWSEQLIGRSALGITGIDISQSDRAVCQNGSIHVPLEMVSYTGLGSSLLNRLYDLADDHHPGEPLVHDGYNLAFGRILSLTKLIQLTGDDLSEALDKNLIAVDSSGEQPDVQIVDNALSLRLEPWELLPNGNILGNINAMLAMLRAGHSARAFVYEHTSPWSRNNGHTMPRFVVGSVVFSPGPFFGQVVGVDSQAGMLPQLPSAAWLDANRSSGLHDRQQPGHRGRQIEVVNTDTEATHPWADARVAIKLYRPSAESDQTHMDSWSGMTPTQRLDRHFSGYGVGV